MNIEIITNKEALDLFDAVMPKAANRLRLQVKSIKDGLLVHTHNCAYRLFIQHDGIKADHMLTNEVELDNSILNKFKAKYL